VSQASLHIRRDVPDLATRHGAISPSVPPGMFDAEVAVMTGIGLGVAWWLGSARSCAEWRVVMRGMRPG
jgi:hypothetical protein